MLPPDPRDRAGEYEAVWSETRRFVVLPGDVYPDVEVVVSEAETYVLVEKLARAGDVAEEAATVARTSWE